MIYKLFVLLLALAFTFSCERKDPCSVLVDGVYVFPELPEDHTMTSQEVTEYWDLPEDICECISTEGLIETCLNYPELRLINAGANPQSGYDLLIKERFRGIRELESRPDRGTLLLKKYQSIDPQDYNSEWEAVKIAEYKSNIINVEIISSQYVNLETLTKVEKIELIETALNIYDKEKSDKENYGLYYLIFPMALTGRLMYLNEYERITELYENSFLVSELLDFYGPTTMETVEIVYNITEEYLIYLNN